MWICYVSQDHGFPEARAISNSTHFIQRLALAKLAGNNNWVNKIIQDPTLESSFTLGFEPRFPSQLTQSFQLSFIDLLNHVVHLGLQLDGKWKLKKCGTREEESWVHVQFHPLLIEWVISYFSKGGFFSLMHNSCCTSQVVVRIQYSSTHTQKSLQAG